MQRDQCFRSQISSGFNSIRRQGSALPLIFMNVAKFWDFFHGASSPCRSEELRLISTWKEKVAVGWWHAPRQQLSPSEYLRFLACKFWWRVRTYIAHRQTELRIPSLALWRLKLVCIIYKNVVCASQTTRSACIIRTNQWVLCREIFAV
jgi:hypothetical protein